MSGHRDHYKVRIILINWAVKPKGENGGAVLLYRDGKRIQRKDCISINEAQAYAQRLAKTHRCILIDHTAETAG
tara:strand:+ start:1642 stop:1863 length:222 start_codon:yes stop_codon:yes gene_type:complete